MDKRIFNLAYSDWRINLLCCDETSKPSPRFSWGHIPLSSILLNMNQAESHPCQPYPLTPLPSGRYYFRVGRRNANLSPNTTLVLDISIRERSFANAKAHLLHIAILRCATPSSVGVGHSPMGPWRRWNVSELAGIDKNCFWKICQ